jgi:AraC-like DNA-binding protein
MKIQVFGIPHALKNYVTKIWFFEKDKGFPDIDDMMLVAPNGLIRLVIPCQNKFQLKNEEYLHVAKEDKLMLIGFNDIPLFVDFEKNEPLQLLGVEFSPLGAYLFFHIRQSEIKNRFYLLSDILDKNSLQIEEQIANAPNINLKVKLLIQFLLSLFVKSNNDLIFEHCISNIIASRGNISVNELAAKTGYSSRWINMKFDERMGSSPKNLCSIIRFHNFYAPMMTKDEGILKSKAFFDFYYDQSHFIKDFKKFTGLTPTQFERKNNNFCSLFYTAP